MNMNRNKRINQYMSYPNRNINIINKKYKKVKKKGKIKKLNILLAVLLIGGVTSLIISGVHLFKWNKDNKAISDLTDKIQDKTKVEEVPTTEDDTTTQVIPQEEIPADNPYWDYIKMSLINVDFTELKKENSDTVGWIQVNGTNINYPFVQTKDNDYYLTHAFNKSYNDAGWVFMDYRNNATEFDKNTIIYGHSRLDQTMFGSLKNLLRSNWYNNKNNYIIKLSTNNQNTLWQVFSVYHIPTTTDYLRTTFLNDNDFKTFTDMLLNRSVYNFNTTVNANDKILTLSTCYANSEKMVMHAKLIKYSDRT